jgi:hypothetical protein
MMTREAGPIMINLPLVGHPIPPKLLEDIRRIEELGERKTLLHALVALEQQYGQRGWDEMQRPEFAQCGYANAFERSDGVIHSRLVVLGHGTPEIAQAEVKRMKVFGLTESTMRRVAWIPPQATCYLIERAVRTTYSRPLSTVFFRPPMDTSFREDTRSDRLVKRIGEKREPVNFL